MKMGMKIISYSKQKEGMKVTNVMVNYEIL